MHSKHVNVNYNLKIKHYDLNGLRSFILKCPFPVLVGHLGIGAYFPVSSPVEGMELGNMSQVYVITVKQKQRQ